MDILMNPDLFTIKQSKEMGIWPPSNAVFNGIWPYVKRLKNNDLIILDVGVMKAENSYLFLRADNEQKTRKIKTIYGIVSMENQEYYDQYFDIAEGNLRGNNKFILTKDTPDIEINSADVVCIHSESKLQENLDLYYKYVKVNGIFCGNDHSSVRVKEALGKFRREHKIGTPISVANDCWFWIKR